MLIPFIRTLILYLFIIVAIRFMGKRQVGELQPTELVVTILISAVASVPMQDITIPLFHGVIPILTLIAAEVLISVCSFKWMRFRRLLTGNPVTIIEEGKINQTALKKLRMSVDDIYEGLRLKDIFDLRQVRYAQVETSGQLSVLIDARHSPVTAGQMGLEPHLIDPFHVIISDGQFSPGSLASLGQNREWLDRVLKANGAVRDADVFLFCADRHDNTIFVKKQA